MASSLEGNVSDESLNSEEANLPDNGEPETVNKVIFRLSKTLKTVKLFRVNDSDKT